jgi:carboxyl-terminal processing protease
MRWMLIGGGLLLCGTVLAVPTSGDSAPPGNPAVDPRAAQEYAEQLTTLVLAPIMKDYVRPVSAEPLLYAALCGLYEAAHVPVPPTLQAEVAQATGPAARVNLARRVREHLGNPEGLRESRALLASIKALTRALDPYSVLVSNDDNSRTAQTNRRFGVGLELDAATADGSAKVRTVLPGGPAQHAGLRPGDLILHAGKADPGLGARAFGLLATPLGPSAALAVTLASEQPVLGQLYDVLFSEETVLVGRQLPRIGVRMEPVSVSREPGRFELLAFRPGAAEPRRVVLERQTFEPELVWGVCRRPDNTWDYFADRQHKIAHVRVGALGWDTAAQLGHVLDDLKNAGAQGLILDLRWSPGGWLNEALAVANQFLNGGTVATIHKRTGLPQRSPSPPANSRIDCPLVVLINGETSGGAELIAAALQDHKRAVIVGERSLGKGSVQEYLEWSLPVQFKLTKGTFVRPSGKNLHRFPDSKPTDDWGVLPDNKGECRLSPELSRQLRDWWLWQTLRPGNDPDVLPLDTPETDPQQQTALQLLRPRK